MIKLGLYSYTIKSVYAAAQISEQAASQMRKRRHERMQRLLLINQLIIEYRKSHPGCGLTKMYYQIQPQGIGRDKFIHLAKLLGYKPLQVFKNQRTTIPGSIKWPNLIEGMLIHNKDQVWQTDITYFTILGTHFYLIFMIDVYTKLIISYRVSKTMHATANLECLNKAIKARKIKKGSGLIHHSDRGSQYTSLAYMNKLFNLGIHSSMGMKGPDNAYAERVNGTIKNEYLHYRNINSYQRLKLWTKQAVEHYNHIRIHDSLPDKMTPKQFEEKILNWTYQRRPKAIIYADGNRAIREDSVFLNCIPKKNPKAHICPIIMN